MPKVTNAYRESRRDDVAQAAMRCLARTGFTRTSMADIIAESGMSAGAIYSHFASKAEIAEHVARLAITTSGEELHRWAIERGRPPSPREIIDFMMHAIDGERVSKTVLLQIWAEATVDDELKAIVVETIGRIRSAYIAELRPWLQGRGEPAGDEQLEAAASTMITLSQGYITYSALFGESDPAVYLSAAARLLAS